MKKLFALLIAVSMISGLYGFTFSVGAAYKNLAGPEGTDPYFGITADVITKIHPMIGVRFGIAEVNLPSGATTMFFGTGVNADILIFIPMAGMLSPYIPVGVWYKDYNTYSAITLKGGVGADFAFGGLGAYLEGGIEFQSISPDVGDSQTENPLYVAAGLRFPVNL
jgi:hypothetical protein